VTGRRDARGAVVLLALSATLIVPLILFGTGQTSEAIDQARHHEPFIRSLGETWPRFTLESYATATTPGYHLALGLVARFVTENERMLRAAGSLFTWALLLVVFAPAGRRLGAFDGVLLALPFAWSPYVVSAGAWMVTDNAGWLFAFLAIASVVFSVRRRSSAMIPAIGAVLATSVRHVHLWSVVPAVLVLAGRTPVRAWMPRALRDAPSERWRVADSVSLAVLLCAPAIVIIFAWWWGGLVPPRYQGLHASGVNPSAAAMTCALAGIFGVFFLPWYLLSGALASELRRSVPALLLGAAGGGVLWLLLPTTYDVGAGRWGALWTLARHVPSIGDHSLLFLPLMMAGSVILVAGFRAAWNGAGPRPTLFLGLAAGAWLVAQMANAQAWQRYCEPMVLVVLCWLAVLARSESRAGNDPGRGARRMVRGALLIGAAFQLAVTLLTVHRVALTGT